MRKSEDIFEELKWIYIKVKILEKFKASDNVVPI